MSEGARIGADPAAVPAAVLAHGWRTAAERGGPAVVLAGRLTTAPMSAVPARSTGPAGTEGPATAGPRGEDVHVVWANRAAHDLLGLGPGELEGVPLAAVSPRQQHGQAWPTVVAALLPGSGGDGVGVVRRPDESTRRVQLQVVPIDGGWLVTLAAHVDDPESVRVVEAEHRFRALADHAPVGIFLSEAGLRLGYVNGPFAALLGTDPGALGGTAWLDAIHPDDRPELLEVVQAVLTGRSRSVRVRLAAPVPGRDPAPDGADDATGPPTVDPGGRAAQRWLHLHLAPTTTPSRAAGFVGTAEDVTDRRAWEQRMSYQAHHDPLTGLVNRRRLVSELTELLSSRRGPDRAFAVLFFDLDGFKEVNDTYGHEAGDRALVEVARRMRRTARERDLVARIAGDEFVVVLRDVSAPGEAEAAARRHLTALSAPFSLSGRAVSLSASIGVALPSAQDTPETLLQAADQVMYDAKTAGSGRYRLAPVESVRPAVPKQTGGTGAGGR